MNREVRVPRLLIFALGRLLNVGEENNSWSIDFFGVTIDPLYVSCESGQILICSALADLFVILELTAAYKWLSALGSQSCIARSNSRRCDSSKHLVSRLGVLITPLMYKTNTFLICS